MFFRNEPSQALPRQLPQRGSQAVTFVAKVLGSMSKFPAVLLALPLRKDFPRAGGRCRAATKGGIWHRAAMTERVFPLKATFSFSAAPPLPQEAGAANAVCLYDPSRENGIPERPQTLRYSELINNFSAEYAQSKCGAHSKSSRFTPFSASASRPRRLPAPCPGGPAGGAAAPAPWPIRPQSCIG